METLKQCVGIDCAKNDFAVCFSVLLQDFQVNHLSSRTFANNPSGFKAFNKWVGKLERKSIGLCMVMEATGVYHQKLAYFLSDLGYQISVVFPTHAKNFSKTLKVKTVTDKISAKSLATMGLERKLDPWTKPDPSFLKMKQLCRRKEQIQKMIVETKNQIEAESNSANPDQEILNEMHELLELLNKQSKSVVKKLNDLVNQDSILKEKFRKIMTVPGLGLLTVATVVGETDGFSQMQNKRQLVSYAGYDVINQVSGTSVKTKPRISKRGNRHIRKAMHMPALAAIRHNEPNKELFQRIVTRTGIKMKGVVAVQRKLLILIYTLWKNDTEYDINYEERLKAALPELD